MIGNEYFSRQTGESEPRGIDEHWPADDKAQRFRHGGEVRRNVDGVCHHEQGDQPVKRRCGELLRQVARQPATCLPADHRANDLDGGHERQRQEHGPTKRVAKLRAGL